MEMKKAPKPQQPKKLVLQNHLSPGDVVVMTAAVESLHAAYPGEYLTDVRTPVPEIWLNNPWITDIPDDEPHEAIKMEYPLIHHSNQRAVNFLEGYAAYLAAVLKRPIPLCTNRPHLYLSEEEKNWMPFVTEHFHGGRRVPYAVLVAGTKNDFTAKQWPVEYYQEVVNRTLGRFQWVQIGDSSHDHPKLKNVIDLVGRTCHRTLQRVVYHAEVGLGPTTYLMHLCAAFEKPYILVAGGREPNTWNSYPRMHNLHTIGTLPCCTTACWRSRVVRLNDSDTKDLCLCDRPIVGLERPVGQCMSMIKPERVLATLEGCCA